MTSFLAVCLGVMVWLAPAPQSFALAEQVGDPVGFFVFETPVGKFVIRRDGMGEITQSGGRRHVFYLKGAGKDSFDRIYFLEHERDVLLCYELRDGTAQLVRFDPVKRKAKWSTPVTVAGVPSLADGMVVIETMTIRAADGEILQR